MFVQIQWIKEIIKFIEWLIFNLCSLISIILNVLLWFLFYLSSLLIFFRLIFLYYDVHRFIIIFFAFWFITFNYFQTFFQVNKVFHSLLTIITFLIYFRIIEWISVFQVFEIIIREKILLMKIAILLFIFIILSDYFIWHLYLKFILCYFLLLTKWCYIYVLRW